VQADEHHRVNASAGLLAWIAASKYCDALPLYRQESIFTRFGIDMSRTTMARWMIELGDIFTPLVELIKAKIFASGVCHADETTVPILEKYHEWIHAHRHSVPPKSKLGEAFTYASNHEQLLRKYVEYGDVAIDNNHIESLIRQFVIGRANWLFCDITDGADVICS
jgi:hypothetical protein